MMPDIGTILPVPKSVSETGFVKIVADDCKNQTSSVIYPSFDYLIIPHDPTDPDTIKMEMTVQATKKEVEKWYQNQ